MSDDLYRDAEETRLEQQTDEGAQVMRRLAAVKEI